MNLMKRTREVKITNVYNGEGLLICLAKVRVY